MMPSANVTLMIAYMAWLQQEAAETGVISPRKSGRGQAALRSAKAELISPGPNAAPEIVEALDILEQVSAGLGEGAINPMVNPLGLEAVKEAPH
jgi:hypothetical protein